MGRFWPFSGYCNIISIFSVKISVFGVYINKTRLEISNPVVLSLNPQNASVRESMFAHPLFPLCMSNVHPGYNLPRTFRFLYTGVPIPPGSLYGALRLFRQLSFPFFAIRWFIRVVFIKIWLIRNLQTMIFTRYHIKHTMPARPTTYEIKLFIHFEKVCPVF